MQQTVIRIQGNLQCQVYPARNGRGAWIAVCEPLKITLQADTWAELMEDIGHALDALLKEMAASNEFDAFLRERGWTLVVQQAIPTRLDDVRFDMPFIPAMIAEGNGTQRQLYQ